MSCCALAVSASASSSKSVASALASSARTLRRTASSTPGTAGSARNDPGLGSTASTTGSVQSRTSRSTSRSRASAQQNPDRAAQARLGEAAAGAGGSAPRRLSCSAHRGRPVRTAAGRSRRPRGRANRALRCGRVAARRLVQVERGPPGGDCVRDAVCELRVDRLPLTQLRVPRERLGERWHCAADDAVPDEVPQSDGRCSQAGLLAQPLGAGPAPARLCVALRLALLGLRRAALLVVHAHGCSLSNHPDRTWGCATPSKSDRRVDVEPCAGRCAHRGFGRRVVYRRDDVDRWIAGQRESPRLVSRARHDAIEVLRGGSPSVTGSCAWLGTGSVLSLAWWPT